MQLATCECAETRLDGVILPFVPYHNCGYIKARKKNIRKATEMANEEAGKNGGFNWLIFNKAFSGEMDRLSAPLHQKK